MATQRTAAEGDRPGPAARSGRSASAAPPASVTGQRSALLMLQRSAGNAAATRFVQRDGPNASMPAPNASRLPKAADPEVLTFEGHALRFDANVLYGVLSAMADKKGAMAPAEFVGRLRNAPPLFLSGSERPNLLSDVLKGLDNANSRLDHERSEFVKKYESTANEAAKGLLDTSEKTINAELARLGITGTTVRGPDGGGYTTYSLTGTQQADGLKKAASALLPFAQDVESKGKASAIASQKLGESQARDPFNLTNRPLVEADDGRRREWLAANDVFEKQRRQAVSGNPSLAIYTEEPGAAAKLQTLSTMDDKALAADVGSKAREKLANIATVRAELGGKFSVWSQPHLQRVTLDQMAATRVQREAVDWEVRKRQHQAADDKLLFAVLAIGLGLVAAIPTGGAGLLAGISVAAGVAGAGLGLYQVGQQVSAYNLATAANATDFDKAKAISDKEADGLDLAMNCVLAVGDVFAAAAAFKALSGLVRAAKGGDVAAALKIAGVADSVGVRGAGKTRIVAEAVAGLSEEALESVAKTAARSGGMTQQQYVAELMSGLAEHRQFGDELTKAIEMMEHVRGRIPDTAREMVAKGKVKVFSEASLISVYGPKVGAAKWQELGYASGFYSTKRDLIFIRAGESPEDLAGFLMHEATHRVGKANPLRGDDFMSEAIAEFAERDFYMTVFAEGGPLAGHHPKSVHIQQFLSWSDEQFMHNIEKRYFAAKEAMPPTERVKFKNIKGDSADEVVRSIFDDIAADYQASLPKGP